MKPVPAKLGHGAVLVIGLAVAFGYPAVADLYAVIQLTNAAALALFALSLALVWGFGGILCFGQAAFFGLGGYAYAIAAINFADTTLAVPIAILVPAACAAALGYFMFYGRLNDVYMGVVTLTVTLILFKLANSTSGPNYRIGDARLGGFNGIPATPPLNRPFDPATLLTPEQILTVAVLVLLAGYFLCAWLLGRRFGRVMVAIRENELRAALLGIDVRRHKLITFAIGGGLAGAAGMLFAQNVLVSPTLFSLLYTAQVIIWVIVGGLGTLIGPILGSVGMQYLMAWLGAQAWVNTDLALGAILIGFVVLVPRGLWPPIRNFGARALDRLWRR
ncbi:MAG: branched-chain amino acid ABC transporter permease [Alphaproteobacteria bacterium]